MKFLLFDAKPNVKHRNVTVQSNNILTLLLSCFFIIHPNAQRIVFTNRITYVLCVLSACIFSVYVAIHIACVFFCFSTVLYISLKVSPFENCLPPDVIKAGICFHNCFTALLLID